MGKHAVCFNEIISWATTAARLTSSLDLIINHSFISNTFMRLRRREKQSILPPIRIIETGSLGCLSSGYNESSWRDCIKFILLNLLLKVHFFHEKCLPFFSLIQVLKIFCFSAVVTFTFIVFRFLLQVSWPMCITDIINVGMSRCQGLFSLSLSREIQPFIFLRVLLAFVKHLILY